jgi:hypothetical protein
MWTLGGKLKTLASKRTIVSGLAVVTALGVLSACGGHDDRWPWPTQRPQLKATEGLWQSDCVAKDTGGSAHYLVELKSKGRFQITETRYSLANCAGVARDAVQRFGRLSESGSEYTFTIDGPFAEGDVTGGSFHLSEGPNGMVVTPVSAQMYSARSRIQETKVWGPTTKDSWIFKQVTYPKTMTPDDR